MYLENHYLYCLIAQDHNHCICRLNPMVQTSCFALIKLHLRCASFASSQKIFVIAEIQFGFIEFVANWCKIVIAIRHCQKPIQIDIVFISCNCIKQAFSTYSSFGVFNSFKPLGNNIPFKPSVIL